MTEQGNDSLALGKVLGAHEARLSALESRMLALETDLKAELKAVRSSLEGLHTTVASVRGGWRVLAIIGACSAALAGIVLSIIRWWKP